MTRTLLGTWAALVFTLAGCAAAPPLPPEPISPLRYAFHPAPGGEALWLTTPFAVEIVCEREWRDVEAVEAAYVGELGNGAPLQPEHVALVAAGHGATHFRMVTNKETHRVDVILFRVERDRWGWLPESLRPLQLDGPSRGEAKASL